MRSLGKLRTIGLSILLGVTGWTAEAASQPCTLPPGLIPFYITGSEESFTPVTLTQVPPGYSITNGTYRGWCVQYEALIAPGPVYNGGLYDSYGPLPGQLQGIPWDLVNYVLNHKRGSAWDVQYVIWHVLGQAISPPANTPQVQMIYDVQQNGQGFVPTNGQIVGVLVEPREGVQRLLLETIWDARCRDTTAPLAAIASPAPGHPYTNAQTIDIVANVSDNVAVTRCEFYHGSTLVTARESGPFRISWSVTEADNGRHQWTIRAFDYAGNVTDSAAIALDVSIDVVAPVVALVNPAPDSRYTTAQSIVIAASASDNFGVTRVEFYDRNQLRAVSTSAPWIFNWSFTAGDNGTHVWTARAYDAAGNNTTSAALNTGIAIDIELPSVTINTPVDGLALSNQVVTIAGLASDNVGIARVELQIDDGPFMLASGTTQWSIPLQVSPGTHHVRVRSFDTSGNQSISATRSFVYFHTALLRVVQQGQGTITPNLNGLQLEVNHSYSMSALAELGHLFTNWTGSVGSTSPQLNFVMQSNLTLQANFVPNVFKPVKGTYAGLFYDTNGVTQSTSGSFDLTTSDNGSFSVKLLIGGTRVSFTGRFDADSKSHQVVLWRGHGPITVDLHLYTLDGIDYIRGSITGAGWSAVLFGDRQNVTGLAGSPHAGKYTIALPDTTGTLGNGYGSVNLTIKGRLDFRGQLGDGTKLRQKAYVSGGGRWPLYLALYKKAGSLIGWVNFANLVESDLNSQLTWTTPVNAGATSRRQVELVGSRYSYSIRPPRAALEFNHGVLTMTGAELTTTHTTQIGLSANNKFVDLSGHGVTLKCNVGTGLFTGKMVDPHTGKKLTLRGALLQKKNQAFGLFQGMTQTGRVHLGAE